MSPMESEEAPKICPIQFPRKSFYMFNHKHYKTQIDNIQQKYS